MNSDAMYGMNRIEMLNPLSQEAEARTWENQSEADVVAYSKLAMRMFGIDQDQAISLVQRLGVDQFKGLIQGKTADELESIIGEVKSMFSGGAE